jgi:hypothetical protein
MANLHRMQDRHVGYELYDASSPLTRIRVQGALPASYSELETANQISNILPSEEIEETIRRDVLVSNLLENENADIDKLRELCWQGIPHAGLKAAAWRIILEYCSKVKSQRDLSLLLQRGEYEQLKQKVFSRELDERIIRLIRSDVRQRTYPNLIVFRKECVQEAMIRVLYLWLMNHPECGYTTGMSLLVAPFFTVYLSQYYPVDPVSFNVPDEDPHPSLLEMVEADSYWSLKLFLDRLPDLLKPESSLVSRIITRVQEILNRTEPRLMSHFMQENLELESVCRRWVTYIFVREFPLGVTLRVWDAFISEPVEPVGLCIYISAALLILYKDQILSKNAQEIVGLLLNLPTENWTESDVLILLSHAYLLQYHALKQDVTPSPGLFRATQIS